ncbi:hypothetical protein D3C81_1061880 [compost metagenome]
MQAFEAVVVLAGQAFDVVAQRQHVLLERGLGDLAVVGGNVLLIGGQADLGVDHHLLVARQHDQHVGLEALAIGTLEADLGLVLAALLQPRVFQHPLQNQFAPVALGLLTLERLGQVGGFIAQAQVELLQAFQLLGQREALAGFLLVAVFDAFFEGLDALLERIEQLPQMLVAGLGKALLALIEYLGGHFGELRPQLVTRALQVVEALLMAFLLFAQLGAQGCALGVQTAQFGFTGRTLQLPGVGGIPSVITVDLQQLKLTGLSGQSGLLGGVGLAQVADFVTAGIQLGEQAFLGQLHAAQALFEQSRLRLARTQAPLHLQHQRQTRHSRHHDTQQNAGQIHCHSHPELPRPTINGSAYQPWACAPYSGFRQLPEQAQGFLRALGCRLLQPEAALSGFVQLPQGAQPAVFKLGPAITGPRRLAQ